MPIFIHGGEIFSLGLPDNTLENLINFKRSPKKVSNAHLKS
ncbi:MAG: hypothetical protein N2235_08955 [Fischerella sp.]|nr:hypothetical protein [Fischerella sp.]